MELQKVLESRRSIRKYQEGREVTADDIKKIISAAQLAPSWKNQQTSRYYCVMGEDRLEMFRNACLPEFNRKNTENASAIIVTTFVSDWSGYDGHTHEPVNELENGWGCYDLGLQNMNMLLKAEELGIGTLIMGIRDADKIRNMLAIPENETIVSVIAAGYGDIQPDMPKRKELKDILKFY